MYSTASSGSARSRFMLAIVSLDVVDGREADVPSFGRQQCLEKMRYQECDRQFDDSRY